VERTENPDKEVNRLGEFIVVTWTVVQGRLKEHEESIRAIMDYWYRNADRFKLKSLRYFVQAIGGEPFSYGRVMIYEYASLADWEIFEKQMAVDREAMALKEQLFTNIDLKTRRVVEWQDQLRDAWLEQ
jgi:hypothetical protein